MKQCTDCGVEKSLSAFTKSRSTIDGLSYICRACNRVRHAQWRDTPKGRAGVMVSHARGRARKKGLEFNLTSEWLSSHLEPGRCEVTGIPFDLRATQNGGGPGQPFTPSLDRIDPAKGYTPDNVQVVVWIYNAAKGIGTHEEVLVLVRALSHQCAP